jgi:peptide deformylase
MPIDDVGTVRELGDVALSRRCSPVVEFDARCIRLGAELRRSLHGRTNAIGLAANQVGVMSRMFAYDLTRVEAGQAGVWCNPTVLDASGSSTAIEGCLSVPGLFWPVTRPSRVTIGGFDEHGAEQQLELSGLAARLFQHEIDHLDGVTMVDRVETDEWPALVVELSRLGWHRSGRHWVRRLEG